MMNHNLLPKEYRRTLHSAYTLRVWWVCVALANVVFIIGAGALLPSFFRISGELSGAQEEYTALTNTLEQNESSATSTGEQTLQERSRMLAEITKRFKEEPLSQTLENTLSILPSGVVVSGITYDRTTSTLLLEGKAQTREDLVSYVHALEKSPHFSKVPSPTANLAKSADIPFRLAFSVVVH